VRVSQFLDMSNRRENVVCIALFQRCDQRCQYFGTCCQDVEVEMRDPDSDEEKSQCSMGNVGEWSLYGWLVLDKNTRLTYVVYRFRFCLAM